MKLTKIEQITFKSESISSRIDRLYDPAASCPDTDILSALMGKNPAVIAKAKTYLD